MLVFTFPFFVSHQAFLLCHGWFICSINNLVYSGSFCVMEFLIALKPKNQEAKTDFLSHHKNNVITCSL